MNYESPGAMNEWEYEGRSDVNIIFPLDGLLLFGSMSYDMLE